MDQRDHTTATAGDSQTKLTRAPMTIVRWKSGKLHVTLDGIKTGCGTLVPATATRTVPTLDWHLHTNCYNCAYRLWPQHGPGDYICPRNGADFPPARKCPHGGLTTACVRCTPMAAQNWPCPNGCTDPIQHDPMHRYTKCTVFPARQPAGPAGRCADGCLSEEIVMHRANPRLHFDLADSASMRCYHCGEPVCVACQKAPVDGSLRICDSCSDADAWVDLN